MAINSATSVSLSYKDATTNTIVFRSADDTSSRTDLNSALSGRLVLAASGTYTVDIANSDISVARHLYVESNELVGVTLTTAATTPLVNVQVTGADGNSAGKMFIELSSGTIDASDLLTFTAGSNAVTVSYFIAGDTDAS